MKIYEYPLSSKISGERVIALGFFDGVHIGHRQILKRACELSRSLGIPSAVFTFPSEAALPKSSGERLYDTKEKISLISECGIDEIIIADFDFVKAKTPEDFIIDILIGELGCRTALSGRDFRFGKNAEGNTSLLEKILLENGRGFIAEDDVKINSEKASTTQIKEYLADGKINLANEMLGSPYYTKAEVHHGRGVGNSLGFPTINTDIGGRVAFLRAGVYKTDVEIDGISYPALTNVGSCPTFGSFPAHAESFIFDYSGDLYGKEVKIFFISYIREEKKFASPKELTEQITRDIEFCRRKQNTKEK